MFVKMWRTLLIAVLWSASVCCYSIKLTDHDRKIGPNPDLVFSEPLSPNSGEEIIEVKSIYYTSPPKTRIVVEYDDGEEAFSSRRKPFDSSEEDTQPDDSGEDPTFQPWSILWYIGSFGGLIAFFLVVSCSEWCCRSHGRNRNSRDSGPPSPTPSEVPPPAYDLFAPPSYESLCHDGEKREYDVYVVPVHAIESIAENRTLQTSEPSAPPAYQDSIRTQHVPEEVVVNVLRSDEEYRERHKAHSEA